MRQRDEYSEEDRIDRPASRADDLTAALAEIEAVLVDVENEALHEAIYVEISRAYS